MSDLITDETVETAARAAYNSDSGGYNLWAHATRYEEEQYLVDARAALEAVAPQIAEAVLRKAADEIDLSAYYPTPGLSELHNANAAAEAFLRARANEMEADCG